MKSKANHLLYHLHTCGEEQEMLGDFYTSGSVAWDSHTMRAVSPLVSFKLPLFAGSYSTVVADAESSPKDVVKVLIDDNVAGKRTLFDISNRKPTEPWILGSPSSRSTRCMVRSAPFRKGTGMTG